MAKLKKYSFFFSIMKKFVGFIICCVLVLFTSCQKNNKVDIGELVYLKGRYETELNVLNHTWLMRQMDTFKVHGYPLRYLDEERNYFFSTDEEARRAHVLEDSIEIINIEIEKYKNGL